MLEIRTVCENCKKSLPPDSTEAMICTFECTYCKECVTGILQNVCPNCGGGFEKRPVRPKKLMQKYPASEKIIHHPLEMEKFNLKLNEYKDIPSNQR